jgi:hypothetical protein
VKIPRRPKPVPAAAQPDRQCVATTLAGKRCRLVAVEGTDKCPLHAPKVPTPPAAA